MGFKGSRLYSVFTSTCPRCHKGSLFVHSNPYRLKAAMKMYPKCQVCGEDFSREPGFYFGAAYVSYALTVGIWVAVYVALKTFAAIGLIDFRLWEQAGFFLVVGTVVLLILLPVVVRSSRVIWIGFFVHYKPGAKDRQQNKKG